MALRGKEFHHGYAPYPDDFPNVIDRGLNTLDVRQICSDCGVRCGDYRERWASKPGDKTSEILFVYLAIWRPRHTTHDQNGALAEIGDLAHRAPLSLPSAKD